MKKYNTAQRLKQIMDERNLKQVDILNLCKPFEKKYGVRIQKSDISQYVNGTIEPRQYKLFVLSKALGVKEAWLMGFEDETNTTEVNIEGLDTLEPARRELMQKVLDASEDELDQIGKIFDLLKGN